MDVRQEIARQVEKLPSDMQEQVLLRFVASLSISMPAGENGARLRQFSSSLDSVSAQQMRQAIKEECERVDAGEWQILAGQQHCHCPFGGG
jgi:ADP-dependent phosphofructokinase/glucokinase